MGMAKHIITERSGFPKLGMVWMGGEEDKRPTLEKTGIDDKERMQGAFTKMLKLSGCHMSESG